MKNKGVMGGRNICLNCPYPKCVYDVRSKRDWEGILRQAERQKQLRKRNEVMREMSDMGMTNRAIADKFGIGSRHVRRILNGR
jgi:hypothetical protein